MVEGLGGGGLEAGSSSAQVQVDQTGSAIRDCPCCCLHPVQPWQALGQGGALSGSEGECV